MFRNAKIPLPAALCNISEEEVKREESVSGTWHNPPPHSPSFYLGYSKQQFCKAYYVRLGHGCGNLEGGRGERKRELLENNYFIATSFSPSFFLSLERQAVILSSRVGVATALPGGRGLGGRREKGRMVPGGGFSLTPRPHPSPLLCPANDAFY